MTDTPPPVDLEELRWIAAVERKYENESHGDMIRAAADELARLRAENERLRARHNPEVCVDVMEYADKIKAENAQLRAALREREADGERLDWLERHWYRHGVVQSFVQQRYFIYVADHELPSDEIDKYEEQWDGVYKWSGQTLRAAVDAARAASPSKPSGTVQIPEPTQDQREYIADLQRREEAARPKPGEIVIRGKIDKPSGTDPAFSRLLHQTADDSADVLRALEDDDGEPSGTIGAQVALDGTIEPAAPEGAKLRRSSGRVVIGPPQHKPARIRGERVSLATARETALKILRDNEAKLHASARDECAPEGAVCPSEPVGGCAGTTDGLHQYDDADPDEPHTCGACGEKCSRCHGTGRLAPIRGECVEDPLACGDLERDVVKRVLFPNGLDLDRDALVRILYSALGSALPLWIVERARAHTTESGE